MSILKSLGNFILPSSSRYGVQPAILPVPPQEKTNVLQITFVDGEGICIAVGGFNDGDDVTAPWRNFLDWYNDPNGAHCYTFVTSKSAQMVRRVDIKSYCISIQPRG